jgi:hypothetical protein
MTAFEIRLKLLEIARDLLIEKYNQGNEIDRINWQRKVNDAERTGDTPPAYERFAEFPTEEDIIKKAKMLNQFVSSKGSEL